MKLKPGTRIGRYRITSLLGRGGMAEVYRARDGAADRDVALKVLAPSFSVGDLALRFAREAHNASSLNHPGCVRVFDHGKTVDGLLYLTMELLEGRSLRRHLDRFGPMSIADALHTTTALLAALDHAHGRGMLHRDVKPENMVVSSTLKVTLIDFGLSRLRDDAPVTAAGLCMGSPTYLAPERFLEQQYDERADLYAAGVILYECLAGRPPFSGTSPTHVAKQHIRNPPPPIDRSLPRSLWQILCRSLAKQPDERFADASSMARALRSVASLPPRRVSEPPPLPSDVLTEESTAVPIFFESSEFLVIRRPSLWKRLRRLVARPHRERGLRPTIG